MKIEIRHNCTDFNSYRAARVKSLFNATTGYNWSKDVELPIEGKEWQIGLIVGASGSGKTSVGKALADMLGAGGIYDIYAGWDSSKPIVDCIAPGGDFNAVTSALSSVGLGDVPAWLRPFAVLSNGEKFRAGLARLVVERPEVAIVDEFTSVIDRQIAKVGASALQKSWRRGPGKIILLSCHYDIIEWLQPDWGYDMNEARFFERDCLQPRPPLKLEIYKVHGTVFPRLFKKHYYLDLPMPIAGEYFVGAIDGEPVCHLAVCPQFQTHHYRATRLVTMPEWQGIGVATKFLAEVCQMHLDGEGRLGKKYTTIFHTSHPQLCMALRHSKKWRQVSAVLYGGDKIKSGKTIRRAALREGRKPMVGRGGGWIRWPLPRRAGLRVHWAGTATTSERCRDSSMWGRPNEWRGCAMKIFICGQKSFGLEVMKRLHQDGHTIVGIAPPPQEKYKDKMVGWAMLNGIPVVSDCDKLTSAHIPDGTDLVVAAHSHWIVSGPIIDKCRYGGIGYHPSLLPLHRGVDAVRWTIKMGDPVTGGSVYRLTDKCDGGDILLQRIMFVAREWDYHELWRRLFPIGVDMLSEACALIERTGNTQHEQPQDEEFATWEPSWDRPRLKRNELLQLGM